MRREQQHNFDLDYTEVVKDGTIITITSMIIEFGIKVSQCGVDLGDILISKENKKCHQFWQNVLDITLIGSCFVTCGVCVSAFVYGKYENYIHSKEERNKEK